MLGLKIVIGIMVMAGLALVLGMLKLIPLSSGTSSFLVGMITGCSIGIGVAWLVTFRHRSPKREA
jgi:hypothetical protein